LAVITWDIIFTNFGIILYREDSKNKGQDQESVRSSTTPSGTTSKDCRFWSGVDLFTHAHSGRRSRPEVERGTPAV
jgi:hypothetical protein